MNGEVPFFGDMNAMALEQRSPSLSWSSPVVDTEPQSKCTLLCKTTCPVDLKPHAEIQHNHPDTDLHVDLS